MPTTRPIDVLFARKRAEVLADGVIDAQEVSALAKVAIDSDRGTAAVSPALRELVETAASRFESTAVLDKARSLLDVPESATPRPDNDLFRYVAPANHHTVRMHDLYIKRDGALTADTGLDSYSRGWGQFNAGVLQRAHGSAVPASSIHDARARAALNALPPAERLDRATRAFGVELPWSDFKGLAAGFTRPGEPDWAGVCYAWSWAALDARLSSLVDVGGPAGERGLWVGGQFLSRADLGNWLMALAAGLSQGAGEIMWYAPEAEDLLKASLGYLMEGGPGFRADIGTAFAASNQIWFQPFVGTDVDIRSVDGPARQALLEVARQPRETSWGGKVPGVEGADVKLVYLTGRYGNEHSDAWEGEPVISELNWAVYAVLDEQGKVVKAMMADDERLSALPGLPERESQAVPRTLFAPDHELVDGILEGAPSSEVQGSIYGPALNFFIGHVLARGVPAPLRKAFEAEPALAGNGPVDAADIEDLRTRYPTLANAYGPEEWHARFASRGLDAGAFGAPEYA